MNENQKYCIKVCKSACCKSFTLTKSYSTMRAEYNNWHSQNGKEFPQSIELIFPMLIPLSKKLHDNKGKPYWVFTCKHLIKDKCSIYKIRPEMCRGFGVEYKGKWVGKDCIYNKKPKSKKR